MVDDGYGTPKDCSDYPADRCPACGTGDYCGGVLHHTPNSAWCLERQLAQAQAENERLVREHDEKYRCLCLVSAKNTEYEARIASAEARGRRDVAEFVRRYVDAWCVDLRTVPDLEPGAVIDIIQCLAMQAELYAGEKEKANG